MDIKEKIKRKIGMKRIWCSELENKKRMWHILREIEKNWQSELKQVNARKKRKQKNKVIQTLKAYGRLKWIMGKNMRN